MSEQPPKKERQLAHIKVKGKVPATWAKYRDTFMEKIQSALDTVIDFDNDSTVREEAKKFTSQLLDFARNKLAREGHEVEKIEAEVRQLYAQIETEHADARKTNAEAAKISISSITS